MFLSYAFAKSFSHCAASNCSWLLVISHCILQKAIIFFVYISPPPPKFDQSIRGLIMWYFVSNCVLVLWLSPFLLIFQSRVKNPCQYGSKEIFKKNWKRWKSWNKNGNWQIHSWFHSEICIQLKGWKSICASRRQIAITDLRSKFSQSQMQKVLPSTLECASAYAKHFAKAISGQKWDVIFFSEK